MPIRSYAAFAETNEEKIYSKATVEGDFADNRILVVLNSESSLEFKNYKTTDFPEINCKKVNNLNKETSDIIKQKADSLYQTYSATSAINISELSKINSYNQVLSIELNNIGKDKVVDAISALEDRDDVLYVGPDYKVYENSSLTPNDPGYSSQTNMNLINAPAAWGITTGSSSIKIGVLDSGIDATHPELTNSVNGSLSRSFLDGITTINNPPTDPRGHGTHVAGIIGALGNNNNGISGICWNVQLISLKVLDYQGWGYSSYVASAIDYAESLDIPILNFSGSWNASQQSHYDYALYTSIGNYSGLFVCTAGNDGSNNDTSTIYPANYILPNLITVGASDNNDQKLNDSNYGQTKVDIFAPGYNILSCYPTVLTASGYKNLSGTSMAAPLVSGVAALMLSVNPNLTAAQLKEMIMENATYVVALSNLCVSQGKLSAYASVLAAQQSLQTHTHNYTHRYTSTDAVHFAYCSCGDYIQESHVMVQSGSYLVCTKCGHKIGLWK